jgi:hypothetical protein
LGSGAALEEGTKTAGETPRMYVGLARDVIKIGFRFGNEHAR